MADDKMKQVIRAAKSDNDWLEDMQARHVRRVERAVKQLEDNIVNQLRVLKASKTGKLDGIKVNLAQAQAIHRDIETLFQEQWNDETFTMTGEYKQYKEQFGKTADWLGLGKAAEFTSVDEKMMNVLRQGHWQDFVVSGEAAKERVIQAVYNDVIAGNQFSTLVNTIQGSLTGLTSVTGTPLANYARLYARDNLMNFMREVHVSKSKDLGMDRFLYVGNIITTTRPFCRQRVGKTYTEDQIKSWTYKWQGKSGPAMTHCGGWNCRHHWRGVRKEWVEEETGRIDVLAGPQPQPPQPPQAPPIVHDISVKQHGAKFKTAKMETKDIEAIGEYQSGAYDSKVGGYTSLQNWARFKQNRTLGHTYDKAKLQRYVDDMDGALAKSVLDEDKILLRGVGDWKEYMGTGQAPVGYRFTDKGFTSTTTSQKVVKRFGQDATVGKNKAVFKINAKKGQNALAPSSYLDDIGEAEVVLPRGLTFEVKKVTTRNKVYYFELDIVEKASVTRAPVAAIPKPEPKSWVFPRGTTEADKLASRSKWDKVDSLADAKRQFKEKFKMSNVTVNNALAKSSKDKLAITNEFGEQLADAIRRNPGMSPAIDRRARLKGMNITTQKDVVKQYHARTGRGNSGVAGYYDPRHHKIVTSLEDADNAITMGGWHPCTGKWNTTFHELGHHYHATGLNNRWATLHNKYKEKYPHFIKQRISRYGDTNVNEAWAELFSLYTNPAFIPASDSKILGDFAKFMEERMLKL